MEFLENLNKKDERGWAMKKTSSSILPLVLVMLSKQLNGKGYLLLIGITASFLMFESNNVKAKLASEYIIQPLEFPYEDRVMEVYEINDSNYIVGGYGFRHNWEGFVGSVMWKNNEIYSIGPVYGPVFHHINNSGDVASSSPAVAIINSQNYVFSPEDFGSSTLSLYITDLNDNGILALSAKKTTQYGDRRVPYRFDGYSGSYMSGSFNYSEYSFLGNSINNANTIVGEATSHDTHGSQEKYVPAIYKGIMNYDPKLIYHDFSNVLFPDFNEINDNGIILGEYHKMTGEAVSFLWTEDSGIITFIGGDDIICRAINNSNQVVGYIASELGADGFIWDPDDSMVDLDDLLPTDSAWSSLYPTDINNNGVMIGSGRLNGSFAYYIMKPIPEPASLFLLTTGCLYLLRRKNRNCEKATIHATS